MAVTHNAQTRWPATDNDAGSTATGNQTFSHAGNVSAKGAVVIVTSAATAQPVTGVLYGGTAMSLEGSVTDTTEVGSVWIYFLGDLTGLGGNQTVTLQGCTGDSKYAVCCTVMADAAETMVVGSGFVNTTTSTNPTVTFTLNANARVYGGMHGGASAPTSYGPGTGESLMFGADWGTRSARTARSTDEATAGSYTFNFVYATSDDWCIAAIGIGEVVPGVTFDALGAHGSAGAGGAAPSSPTTWQHTCSGDDRLLLVGVTAGGTNVDTQTVGVTYAGQALTSLGTVLSNNGVSGKAHLFGRLAPATGTNTVEVTFSGGSGLSSMQMGSISFNDVEQSSLAAAVTNIATASGNAANPTVNVSSAVGHMVVDVLVMGGTITSSADTQRWLKNVNSTSGGGNGGQATQVGATSVTMNWTAALEWYGILAANIVAAGAGQTAQLGSATADWDVQPVTVTGGAVTVTLGAVARTWTVQALTVTPGPISAQVGPVQSTWVVQPLAVTVGAVTVTLANAEATWTVQPLSVEGGGGTPQEIQLAAVARTWATQPVAVTPGPVSVALSEVARTWAVQPLSVTTGPVTVTIAPVARTWAAQPVTLTPGPVTVTLSTVARTWAVQPVTVTPGPITAQLSAIPAVWQVQPVSVAIGAQFVALAAVARTWTVQPLSVVVGAITTALSEVARTWTVQPPTLTMGGVTVSLGTVARTWQTQPADVSAAQVVSLGAANATWQVRAITVTPGAVQVPLASATVVASPQAVTLLAGAVSVTLGSVAIQAQVYPLSISTGVQPIIPTPAGVSVVNGKQGALARGGTGMVVSGPGVGAKGL